LKKIYCRAWAHNHRFIKIIKTKNNYIK